MSDASNGGYENSVSRAGATDTQQRSRFESRTIGIYGPRSAGKTCYLAASFLGASSSANCTFILGDEDSRSLLLDHWNKLKVGEKPAATALSFSRLVGSVVISISEEAAHSKESAAGDVGISDGQGQGPESVEVVQRKRRVPFQTRDFGGEIAERGNSGAPQLTTEFHRWLEEADCLLFFLAADQLQKSSEAEKRLLEVDTLLARLVEKSLSGHAISQPIAVLVTKWDLVSDLSGTPEEERKKLIEFLRKRAGQLGYNICEKIERAGEQVQVFPVSTFGGHVDDKPICPLKPFNLHEPLVWAIKRTDRCLYEKARVQANAALDRPLWKNYTAAIEAYKRLIEGYGINHGPFYKQVQADLSSLYRERARRTWSLLAVCGVVLLGAVLWGSYSLDRKQYIELAATLEAPRDSYPELESRVIQYQKSYNLWAGLLGNKADIAARWDQYQQSLDQSFGELEGLRKSPAPAELGQRIEHYRRFVAVCQDFLGKYPESPYQDQVSTWRNEAQEELHQLEFVHSVETLISQWAEPKTPQKAEDLLRQANELAQRKPNTAPGQAVEQALAKLNELTRELNASLGDARAKCEQFVDKVKNLLEGLKKAIAERPAELEKLQKVQAAGEALLKDQLPDHPELKQQVNEARKSLSEQLTKLRETIETLERDVQQWLAEAENARSSAEKALNDGNRDLSPMKKKAEALVGLVEKAQNLPIAPGVKELSQRLHGLKEELDAQVKRYEQFDEKYAKLNNDLRTLPPEKQRSLLGDFLRDHPDWDYPRRRTELAQLDKKMIEMGGDIDKSRWDAVVKKFEEFCQLCEKLGGGTRLEVVHREYEELRARIEDYQRQTDPAPQRADKAAKLLADALRLLDKAEWKDVELFASKNDKDYEAIAERAKQYLDGNDRIKADQRAYKEDAERMIRQAIADRWRELYRAFYDRATNMTTLGDLSDAEKACRSFLAQVREHPNGAFRGFLATAVDSKIQDADNWLAWSGQNLADTAPNIRITVDPTPIGDRKVWVGVKLDGKPAQLNMDGNKYDGGKTPWFKETKNIEIILPRGNFREPSRKVDVSITIDNWWPKPDASTSVTVQVPEVFFHSASRRQQFQFPGWEGKGMVEFYSRELTPPRLDPP